MLGIRISVVTSVCCDRKTYLLDISHEILKSINLPGSFRDETFPAVAVFCWPCTSGWGRGPAAAEQGLRTLDLCFDPYAFLIKKKILVLKNVFLKGRMML